MITREELKNEVDKLPENLLQQAYSLLQGVLEEKVKSSKRLTIRNFEGKLDNLDIRKTAYE